MLLLLLEHPRPLPLMPPPHAPLPLAYPWAVPWLQECPQQPQQPALPHPLPAPPQPPHCAHSFSQTPPPPAHFLRARAPPPPHHHRSPCRGPCDGALRRCRPLAPGPLALSERQKWCPGTPSFRPCTSQSHGSPRGRGGPGWAQGWAARQGVGMLRQWQAPAVERALLQGREQGQE